MEQVYFQVPSNDGLLLDVVMVKPDTIKGIVQMAHGMCEHKERYLPLMYFLANHGYLCVMHDHRGHGKSIKDKKDLGYFYEGKEKALVEDLEIIQKHIKPLHPNIPYYLFGHSMGSLAVRAYLKKYDDHIDGLIVCGSPSANPVAKLGLMFVRFLSTIKGDYYTSQLVDQMVMGSFNRPFQDEHLKNAWLSRDKEVVNAYNEDPLCGYSFTMNGYASLLSLMIDVYDQKNWQMKNKNLPIYFVSGKEDPCKTSDKAFYHAVDFLKQLGYCHVSSHLFTGMRHEILNEIGKEEVYEHLLQELKQWNRQ